jgi:hypothetical protein
MVYRTLTLVIAALWSAQATAADMDGVYVAPGGIYAPAAQVYVQPAPEYAPPAYGPPAYGPPPIYRAPAYVAPRRVYPVPAPVYGAPIYAAPPAYVGPPPYWTRPYRYGPVVSYGELPVVRPPAAVPYGAAAPCIVEGDYGHPGYCN